MLSGEIDAIPIEEKTPEDTCGGSFSLEDRGEVRELIQAGMAALSDPPEPEEIGELDGDQLLLDVASLEVSGLALRLVRHTYDARLTTTAEAVVIKDSDGIRVLSVGRLAFRDEHADRTSDSVEISGDDPTRVVSTTKTVSSLKERGAALRFLSGCHSCPRPLYLREDRLQSLFTEGDLAVLGRGCGVLRRGLALLLLRGRVGGIAAVVDDLPCTFLTLRFQGRGSHVVNRGKGALLNAVLSLSDSLVLLLGCGAPCSAGPRSGVRETWRQWGTGGGEDFVPVLVPICSTASFRTEGGD